MLGRAGVNKVALTEANEISNMSVKKGSWMGMRELDLNGLNCTGVVYNFLLNVKASCVIDRGLMD
jgi:hypothetical protein